VNRGGITPLELRILKRKLASELKQLATQGYWLAWADTKGSNAVPQPNGGDTTTGIPYRPAQLLETAGKVLDLEPIESSNYAALRLKEEVGNPGGLRAGNMALGKMKQQVADAP
jgi:hypothetical protein